MARKKKSESVGEGSWLNTYSDMVTLLLTFFIMLYSISTVRQSEWEKIVRSFKPSGDKGNQTVLNPKDVKPVQTNPPQNNGKGPTTNTGKGNGDMDFDELFEYLKKYVQDNHLEATVDVNKGKECVYIRFSDVVFFDADSHILKKDSIKLLDFLGDALKQVEDELMSVVIAGHTAYVDGPYRVSDRRLSGERASSVAIFLQDEEKISPKKIQAIGHGANFPIASNNTQSGRKKNRRVELMILSNDADLSNKDIINYLLKGTFDDKAYPASGGIEDVIIPKEKNEQEASSK